jgi:site-specific DNA-methyltransferase (adenine-specific)
MNQLVNCDCLDYLDIVGCRQWDTLFADPPDNIGLGYNEYSDRHSDSDYIGLLRKWLSCFVLQAKTVWFSYNAKWTFEVGKIVTDVVGLRAGGLEAKPCVQIFTFGQHNHHDLGNNHRPLIRIRWTDAPLYPDAIRVASWRQEHGDKRADPRGRVPGDCFDFPRVTGNSKQRRSWHPTQLNEGLVERCLKLTTPPRGSVIDPFGGTGTTLRVCKALGLSCTLIELDKHYCDEIAKEHGLARTDYIHRRIWEAA